MAFLSHTSSPRSLPSNVQPRRVSLQQAFATLVFLSAIGFSAAFVFGLVGH
jgi:hypothetical protein